MKKQPDVLSEAEVKHIAKLANLELTEKEITKFQKQLSEILAYVEKLSQVNTQNTSSISQVTGLENVFRDDNVRPSLSQKEVLKNASNKYKGYFKVKAILE